MRLSPITLLEGSLVFDRAEKMLISAEPDAISIVDLGASGQTMRLPIRDARAVTAFADQLWIATHGDQLLRIDHAGRALGPLYSLPFAARAVLQPAPCGPVAAIWSSTPAIALIDDLGHASSELSGVDIAIPLTGRRFVTARGAELTSPSGVVTMLAPNTTVLAGAVMSDGKSVTLLIAYGGGRQLVVVSLGSGQITRRCATPSSTIPLATRRSLAIALLEPRKIWVLDLHSGRELGTIGFDDDLDDFAIDPSGQRLAVRCGNRSVALYQLVDLLRRPLTSVRTVSDAATPHATPEHLDPLEEVFRDDTDERGERARCFAQLAALGHVPGVAILLDCSTRQETLQKSIGSPPTRSASRQCLTSPGAPTGADRPMATFAMDPRTRQLSRHQLNRSVELHSQRWAAKGGEFPRMFPTMLVLPIERSGRCNSRSCR
jgi:hypothetical protein